MQDLFHGKKAWWKTLKIDSSALDVLDKMEVNTPNGTDKVVKTLITVAY